MLLNFLILSNQFMVNVSSRRIHIIINERIPIKTRFGSTGIRARSISNRVPTRVFTGFFFYSHEFFYSHSRESRTPHNTVIGIKLCAQEHYDEFCTACCKISNKNLSCYLKFSILDQQVTHFFFISKENDTWKNM